MSLEQKIQTLKEDFLDRDQTTFVKIRRTESLTGDPEKSNISSDSQSETVKADRNLVGKVCEGRAERGTQKGCVVIKEKDWFYLFIDFSN